VKLFEVFWHQVVELVKARPDLSIQDITALLVSLTNLSLSCYPDRLEYVDQVLAFATDKINEFKDMPDLHNPQTTTNLLSLLAAPINSYQSVLTLLALPRYVPLLTQQPFNSRRSLAHSIVSSVLKNETVIETPEDVDGVLELCQVLIQEQVEPINGANGVYGGQRPRAGVQSLDLEQLAEEQGWVARMVHLFRADDLEVQFEVCLSLLRLVYPLTDACISS
jgi:vacuolar protein sorting-associated protein 35